MDFDTFWRRMRRARAAEDCGLVVFHRIPSSHQLARRAAREYQAEGHSAPASDFVAWQQTAGQGRHGRTWSSPAGCGVYASMVRRLRPSQIRALPMTVPTALAGALRDAAGIVCSIKWPNDLMIDGKKLGGILIDVLTSGEGDPLAVISFGVNHGDSGRFDDERAVSACDLGASLPLDELAIALMSRVDRDLNRIAEPAEVLAVYRELSAHQPGDQLECRSEDGSETMVRGKFLGIDGQGLLRLQVGTEERRLSAGRLMDS